jgi:hypothetical protein
MFNNNQSLLKLLKRPMAKKILELLLEETLSITQIVEILKNSDKQTIIAFLTELQRYGLIETKSSPSREIPKEKEEKRSFPSKTLSMNEQENWLPPLGISVTEYNVLWQELSKNSSQNIPLLDRLYFMVPEHFKQRIKEFYEVLSE